MFGVSPLRPSNLPIGWNEEHIPIRAEAFVDDAVFHHQFIGNAIFVLVNDAVMTVAIGVAGVAAANDPTLLGDPVAET